MARWKGLSRKSLGLFTLIGLTLNLLAGPFPLDELRSMILPRQQVPSKQQNRTATYQLDTELHMSTWMKEYITWHNTQRRRFPDTLILEDPEAPKVLLLYYDSLSPGLYDRFQDIGKLLYIGFELNRVVLLTFASPRPLETFLVPSLFNWTVPITDSTNSSKAIETSYQKFMVSTDKRPHPQRNIHVLAFKETGNLKKSIGDKMDDFKHIRYRDYWLAFFQPSPLLVKELEKTYAEMGWNVTQLQSFLRHHQWNLRPEFVYDAIHCRVRHPAHENTKDAIAEDLNQGLMFSEDKWIHALQTARRSFQCSQWLLSHPGFSNTSRLPPVPIYFYSDSEPLVRALVSPDSATMDDSGNKRQRSVSFALEDQVHKLAQQRSVVGRYGHVVAHIQEPNLSTEAYMSSFVDLYLAVGARCLVMGVGRFAYLASQISGTSCTLRYERVSFRVSHRWGMDEMNNEVRLCDKK